MIIKTEIMHIKNQIQKLSDELVTECIKQNKRCTITIVDLDKSTHNGIVSYVCNRVVEHFGVQLSDLKNWRKTEAQRKAKKMIVFLLVTRLAIPIKDVAAHLGISSQSISYLSLNPYGVYKIDGYENFVYKIESEIEEGLYLSS